jgi:hypothetical protein
MAATELRPEAFTVRVFSTSWPHGGIAATAVVASDLPKSPGPVLCGTIPPSGAVSRGGGADRTCGNVVAGHRRLMLRRSDAQKTTWATGR